MPIVARTPSSRALSQPNPPIKSATSADVKNSSLSPATSAVTTIGKATATMTRILLTVSVDSLIHSLRMASIITDHPRRSRRSAGGGGSAPPDWYSWAPAVAWRNASSSDSLCGDSSCSTVCGLQGELADPLDRQALDVDAVGTVRPVTTTGALEDVGERRRVRRAHAHPSLGVAVDELAHRALLDQLATADDDEVVGHQRDLGEQVAADEDRAALAGEGDEDVADPAHAFGIEAVGRLVEDQRVRVTEQHAGESEALAHAERVAADLALGDRGHPDELEHGVDP